jgi:hypothetical protein
MTTPERADDARPPCDAVALDCGRTITRPPASRPCEWIAVLIDGAETHRAVAAIVGAAPVKELTRLADALSPGRAAIPDLPVEGSHNHGAECAVRAFQSGNTLRFAAAPAGVENLRVCDPAGAEIAYWAWEEFAEDPADVRGAGNRGLASTGGGP